MMKQWWVNPAAGLVDDDGHQALPSQALFAQRPSETAEAWMEIPGTRWGRRARELSLRANFEHLEKTVPSVQRVVAVEQEWRALLVRAVDAWRLEELTSDLESGRGLSAARETALMRRLLREQVETQEGMEAMEELPGLICEAGDDAVARTLASTLDADAVVRAYLTIAADTVPLPAVDALGASFPAHEVVMDRLVRAVRKRPELVMAKPVMGGAPSWDMYERWLLA
jgi:hypothetical protein